MATNVALLVLGLLAIILLIPVNGVQDSRRNAQEATQDPLKESKLYDQYGNYVDVPTGGMVGGRRGRDGYPYYGNYPSGGYGYPYGPGTGGRYPGGGRGGMLPGGGIGRGGMFPGGRGGGMLPGGGIGGGNMFPGVGIGGGGMFPGRRMGAGGIYPGFPGFSPALCPSARCCSFLPDGSCNFCCPPTVLPTPPRAP